MHDIHQGILKTCLFVSMWQIIGPFNCNLPISSGHVSWQVPAPCWSQIIASAWANSAFDEGVNLLTRWLTQISKHCHDQWFQSNVCILFCNSFATEIIGNKFIEAIAFPGFSSTRNHMAMSRVALREIIPAQISDGMMLCNSHQSVDLVYDTGHIGYRWHGRNVMDMHIS